MDNELNAFEQGVEPGGLRNKSQIKLLIEYLVDSLTEPLTVEIAIESLTLHSIANYFETVEAIDELVSNGSILNDDNILMITRAGSESLRELKNELPVSVRELALEDAISLQIKARNKGATNVKITPNGEGYDVSMSIFHKEETMMRLMVHAVDFEQADKMRTSFENNPLDIYETILSTLLR